MKHLIIIVFSIILGVFIFQLIIGEDNSLRNAGENVMQQQLEQQKITP